MSEDTSARDVNAEAAASLGWGPFKLNVKGSVSHKSSQTRKTDTRARYAFNTTLKRQDPPEAMMRVIDFLTEAATKPVLAKDATQQERPSNPPSEAQEERNRPTA